MSKARKGNIVKQLIADERERRALAETDALIVRVIRRGVVDSDIEQLSAALVAAEAACREGERV